MWMGWYADLVSLDLNKTQCFLFHIGLLQSKADKDEDLD